MQQECAFATTCELGSAGLDTLKELEVNVLKLKAGEVPQSKGVEDFNTWLLSAEYYHLKYRNLNPQ